MILLYRNPWFWILLTVFLIHQIVEKALSIRTFFIDNYLDDLLCMPILLSGWMAEQYDLFGKKGLTKLEILGLWVLTSLVFEGLLPRLYPGYTADGWDVVCYGVGSLFFYGWINEGGPDLKSDIIHAENPEDQPVRQE